MHVAVDEPADAAERRAPFDGVPVAFSSASGNVAQPVAGEKRTPAIAAPDLRRQRERPPVSSTLQSAAGLGAPPRRRRVTNVPSGR